jgi:hypothetical protein
MAIRHYDKGERRYKHVGKKPWPEIECSAGNPRMWIGKCPSNLLDCDCVRLLEDAIIDSNGDREINFPKKLYVVHEGAIYEAQTTDQGRSYHGYPYRGRLSRKLIGNLRNMAIAKNCEDGFNKWVKQYIEVHGT